MGVVPQWSVHALGRSLVESGAMKSEAARCKPSGVLVTLTNTPDGLRRAANKGNQSAGISLSIALSKSAGSDG